MGTLDEAVLKRLCEWRSFRALVIGDFMLDQELQGAAERLSPDAPVPVLLARGMADARSTPGGAGNVARFIAALGGEVDCVGIVGADEEGATLRRELQGVGCGDTGLLQDPSRPTTVKLGLIGLAQHRHPQKMFRLDFEDRSPLSEVLELAIIELAEKLIPRADVVCLEDYTKGVCTDRVCRAVIDGCRRAGVPVLVDPAPISDYARYRGATCITPNRSEAERATGSAALIDPPISHSESMAHRLRESLDLEAVVVTLDKHGAILDAGEGAVHLPAIARAVYDVTGAGDMMLAALAGARANGFTWSESVTLANVAAGLEVEAFGAQPVPLAAVQRKVLTQARGTGAKVRTLPELLGDVSALRVAGKRIVLTNGCFDILHAGHVAYLREARALGDVLVVGLNSDESVRANKGASRPVFSEGDRAEVLAELTSVDFVVPFEELTAHDLIRAIRPDCYAKGGDYRPDEVAERDLLQELGCRCYILSLRAGLSSSEALRRIGI
ncbi:MAG: bifunctional heptose 7-phosphate kinase/heptose 1-phosphate adenyltransferase [Phycisphaerales bacterium]|nr:bifunctional heptose 7-phosphate kinase/heptose 1-phosphate adenyltransferase [Phycisphaerales bacterium]